MILIHVSNGEINKMSVLIGVISDTHGLIRQEALDCFAGADVIFHGGDIGSSEVLRALEQIAPVVAVRGNCDDGGWSKELPVSRSFEINGRLFLIIHKLPELKIIPKSLDGVIFGHSHQSKVSINDGILYLNPGSAGPRRFRLPVSVARIRIEERGKLLPEIVELV